ncbi:MAG: hypothetical protein JSU01_20235 [Bacteroidetes bacterium]|nr:hypothetical protein [Bacteroidota bacterium]
MDNTGNGEVMILFGEPRYFISFIKQKGLNVYSVYKDVSLLTRIIRKFFFILKLPEAVWYDNWKHKLGGVKTIILFFTQDSKIIHYIKSINPDVRLVVWYWNPAFIGTLPDVLPDSLCEKWSFDENDALKFGMKSNTQFFLDNITLPGNEIVYDVLFVGKDKGRKQIIDDLENDMSARGIRTYFYVVDDNLKLAKHNRAIPYEECLALLSKSKSILDIIQPGQSGLTLRPLEALFLKKKLITNDPSIKTQKFYHPNNVFIIREDNMDDLTQFLATPFENISIDILKYYDLDSWFKRFFE